MWAAVFVVGLAILITYIDPQAPNELALLAGGWHLSVSGLAASTVLLGRPNAAPILVWGRRLVVFGSTFVVLTGYLGLKPRRCRSWQSLS